MGTSASRAGWWRMFRWSVALVAPLLLILVMLTAAVLPLVRSLLLNWTDRDLDDRATLIAQTLVEPVHDAAQSGSPEVLSRKLNELTKDDRLLAIGVCAPDQHLYAWSKRFPIPIGCTAPVSDDLSDTHVSKIPIPWTAHASDHPSVTTPSASMMVLHNRKLAWRRGEQTQRYVLWVFTILGVCLTVALLVMVNWSWQRWVRGVQRVLLDQNHTAPGRQRTAPEIEPLLPDLRRLLRSVHEDRRILMDTTIQWRAETLRLLLREHLFGDEMIVVSNREPYIHQRQCDGSIKCERPASGLVTAVEPVMRACSGTWIAHGSGSADRDVVDARSRIIVPPPTLENRPVLDTYTLRRVWLTPEEEKGYYFGFANEGMWPLCHIAHVRPVFRDDDWRHYQAVNARFADAIVEEACSPNPVVLVQDYHFALLPRLLRERLPRATILTFWHIPWPNAESFSICPWGHQILDGLLGSTILGFHTRYHCQNFLDSVDRQMESRICKEDASVVYQGHRTRIRDYPISIHWAPPSGNALTLTMSARSRVLARYGLPDTQRIGIGVDRLDYTKGIVERMLALEHMLDTHPEWQGHFTFIQIAAPTRSILPEYQQLDQDVRQQAQRINEKFASSSEDAAPAIVLLIQHHDAASVQEHYKAADIAMVTSLHDGMNLVAKEYVAARDMDDGVLILSRFAGAADELYEALVVNPYHVGQTAEALFKALTMSRAEQQERMRAMRKRLSDFNIYRWAGRMLLDAADERQRSRVQDRIVQISAGKSHRFFGSSHDGLTHRRRA